MLSSTCFSTLTSISQVTGCFPLPSIHRCKISQFNHSCSSYDDTDAQLQIIVALLLSFSKSSPNCLKLTPVSPREAWKSISRVGLQNYSTKLIFGWKDYYDLEKSLIVHEILLYQILVLLIERRLLWCS